MASTGSVGSSSTPCAGPAAARGTPPVLPSPTPSLASPCQPAQTRGSLCKPILSVSAASPNLPWGQGFASNPGQQQQACAGEWGRWGSGCEGATRQRGVNGAAVGGAGAEEGRGRGVQAPAGPRASSPVRPMEEDPRDARGHRRAPGPEGEDEVRLTGWVFEHRRGHFRQQWYRRYFVLRRARLAYFGADILLAPTR